MINEFYTLIFFRIRVLFQQLYQYIFRVFCFSPAAYSRIIRCLCGSIAFSLPNSLQGILPMIDYGMNRRKLYWILPAVLVISALSIYSFYENNVSMPRLYQTSSMHQVHLKHKQGNDVTWELSAESAFFPTGKKVVYLKSPGIKINHTPEIYLTAGNGIYEIEKEEINLSTPVEINMNETKFTAETLKLNSSNETATTDDAIKYSGRDFLIEGKGLIANMKQKEIRIKNDIKATFYR